MCKILALAGIAPDKQDLALAFLQKSAERLYQSERDGYGYAVVTPEGNIYGERWLRTFDVWKRRESPPPIDFAAVLEQSDEYNQINGLIPRDAPIVAMIAHARTAAGDGPVCSENVHPFVRNEDGSDYALIHNGIVTSPGSSILNTAGSNKCDSMAILNAYIEASVPSDPINLRLAIAGIDGSFACAVLGGEARPYLDIFKNGYPRLSACAVRGLGLVFCTEADIVTHTAKELELEVAGTWKMKAGILVRIDAISGRPISFTRFADPVSVYSATQGRTYDWSSYRGHTNKTNGAALSRGEIE